MSIFMTKLSIREQIAYTKAGTILEQKISSIRTVSTYSLFKFYIFSLTYLCYTDSVFCTYLGRIIHW